jgi:hypothetical protein
MQRTASPRRGRALAAAGGLPRLAERGLKRHFWLHLDVRPFR